MRSLGAKVAFYLLLISNVVEAQRGSGNEFELPSGMVAGNDDDEYSTAKCVPCENEDEMPNLDADIEGITCEQWNRVNKLSLANSVSCTTQRLLGVKYCGCKIPEEHEEFECQCPASRPRVRVNSKMTGTSLLCEEAAYIKQPDGAKTCKVFTDACCSAPSTTDTTCTLCKVKDNYPTQPNLIILGRSDGKTCGDLANQLVLGPTDCHAFNFNHTIDEAAYCECPGIKPRKSCEVCPRGQKIVNLQKPISDTTDTIYEFTNYAPACGDYNEIADFITGRSTCTQLKKSAVQNGCCEVVLPSERSIGPRGIDEEEEKSGATMTTTATTATAAFIATLLLA